MSDSEARRIGVLLAASVAMVLTTLSGCSKRDIGVQSGGAPVQPASGAATDTSTAVEYKTTEVADAATLRGIIRYTGTPPTRTPVTVGSDKEVCGRHNILSEDLIVSANGGVRNAVVWLDDVEEGKTWPEAEVIQDQKDCVFTPHVVVVGVNQPLTFVNSDPVVHNVRTFPRENLPLNISLLAKGKGKPSTKSFMFPDEIKAACDSHKWMGSWIIVRNNPYFAVTGDDGSYVINGVPPGTYTVVYWHESLERIEKKVELAAGETRAEDLEMKDR